MKHFFISETSPILNGSAFEHTRKAKIKLVSKEKYSEESPLNQDFLGNVVEIPTTKSKKKYKNEKKNTECFEVFLLRQAYPLNNMTRNIGAKNQNENPDRKKVLCLKPK